MATQPPQPSTAVAKGQGQAERLEDDLNKVLTAAQRRELIDLVNATMDVMQETLCHPSECLISTTPGPPLHSNSQQQAPSSPQKRPSRQASRVNSSANMTQVKIELEAFDYFKAWKRSVLVRLREVIEVSGAPGLQRRNAQADSSSLDVNGSLAISTNPDALPVTLNQLPMETRLLVTNSLLLLLLSLKSYSAHSRVLLLKISGHLGISPENVAENEIKVAQGLLQAAKEMSAREEAKSRADQSKASRRWKIGLASVAGAVLVGVTGGLAAPLVAGGLGMIMGTLGLGGTVVAGYLGAVAGSGVIIGSIFGAFGAKMTGRMMEQYAREVKDFAFLPLRARQVTSRDEAIPESADNRLRVTIGISGWLTEAYDLISPWRVLGDDSDVFALRWELEALLMLGNATETLVRRFAFTIVARQLLGKTLLAPFSGPLMIPIIAGKLSHLIDNPFCVAKTRAVKAGEILADALINKAQGQRPVTLIGYSMGARVIYTCLLSLAKRRAFGLIESAILIGSPAPAEAGQWRLIRTVVSGRLLNVYSEKDFMLKFLYRAQSMQMNVAGIQPIEGVPGVENFDASEIVSGHLRYSLLVGIILKKIGFDHLNQDELRVQADRFYALAEADARRFEQGESQGQLEQEQLQPHQQNIIDSDGQDQIERGTVEETISDKDIQDLEEEIARRTEESLAEIHHTIQLEDREA
ncbi:predicted protein [Uncinocarpus reesii 1704]|uniref:DUF726 domain-containing protein n=1 Tax=Uncinocarpus reesii (strain UAMH 1704) TaxID=336963 RepID=C4JV38_UNCRE|nr:uncharacterized protein UREG_06430 [Uncinocarpus reesii 1704]EEP81565.1 predicted protein [Uncinocarpus reesii 1704]